MARPSPKRTARRKPRKNGVEARFAKLEAAVRGLDGRVVSLEAAVRKMPELIEREGVIVVDKIMVALSKRLEMHEHRVEQTVEGRMNRAEGRINLAIEEIRAARVDMNDNAKALLDRYGETVAQFQCPQAACPAAKKP